MREVLDARDEINAQMGRKTIPASFAARKALRRRRITLSELRKPVLYGSALAAYLETVYHQPLSPADLQKIRLTQLQWAWYFAPFDVSCLYLRINRGGTMPLYDAAPAHQVCSLARNAPSGAARIVGTRGLRVADLYGYALPYPMASCPGERGEEIPTDIRGHATIEVIRIDARAIYRRSPWSGDLQEGGPRGCWFVAQRGTGIFLRAGRTLRVSDRKTLLAALPSINVSSITKAAKEHRPPVKLLESDARRLLAGKGTHRTFKPMHVEDVVGLCTHIRAAGYETAIMDALQPAEVIHCGDDCMAAPLLGPCVPASVFTGINASLPCECNNSLQIINCQPFPDLAVGMQPLTLAYPDSLTSRLLGSPHPSWGFTVGDSILELKRDINFVGSLPTNHLPVDACCASAGLQHAMNVSVFGRLVRHRVDVARSWRCT